MKERPYVTIKKTNLLDELTDELINHLPNFMQYQGIAGIMLDGGMSRGFADDLSEIDVVLFVHENDYEHYQNNITPTGLGITVMDGYLYDIKLLNYEKEMNKDYDPVALWDLSYARILYDPKDELKILFEQKLSGEIDLDSAGGYLFEAWWNYRLAGDIWIHRDDALQGHYILGNALKPLISALFLANHEYIPHEKWLVHMSRSLKWLPRNYEQLIQDAISTGDMSINSLIKRQRALHELWSAVDIKLCELAGFHAGVHFMQKQVYKNLNSITQKGSCSLKEWEKEHSLAELNYEPLHSLLYLQNDDIIYKEQKAMSLSSSEMDGWFYQIVKAVL